MLNACNFICQLNNNNNFKNNYQKKATQMEDMDLWVCITLKYLQGSLSQTTQYMTLLILSYLENRLKNTDITLLQLKTTKFTCHCLCFIYGGSKFSKSSQICRRSVASKKKCSSPYLVRKLLYFHYIIIQCPYLIIQQSLHKLVFCYSLILQDCIR